MPDQSGPRCAVVDNILAPCRLLDAAMESEINGRRKGVTLLEIFNFKKGRVSKSAAVLKSGDFAARGIVVNYCPFCGAAIAEHIQPKAELAEQD